MGNVIRREAAREKIFEDATITVTNADARAKPGMPNAERFEKASAKLTPILTLFTTIRAKRNEAVAVARPLVAAVTGHNDASDDLLMSHYDLWWNEVGRPASDVQLDLLYPGGASFYTDVPVDEQPIFMELLAELLDSKIHPRFDDAKAAARASETRASAATLEAAIEAARKPLARVKLYDRVLTSIGKGIQIELARLKKGWSADGVSEADVHEIIPDRPRSYGVEKKAETPTDPVPTA